MRVAIVGTGGIGRAIARAIHDESSHQLLLLSRTPQPELARHGFQVMAIDYGNPQELTFALRGVDVVICTVPGPMQLQVIEAAIHAGVRRFAPAEFEGLPSWRAVEGNPLDNGKQAVLTALYRVRDRLESTSFVCGVLYDRFGPGGLRATDIGRSSGFDGEGAYLANIRYMTAHAPLHRTPPEQVHLCLTSLRDLGRFIIRALDLPQWPAQLSMCSERLPVWGVLQAIEQATGQTFRPNITYSSPAMLQAEMAQAQQAGNLAEMLRVQELYVTAAGRYDFTNPSLNGMFPEIVPVPFQAWVAQAWGSGSIGSGSSA